ncbi:hypothetical protein DICVIV_13515 [Dictyocaulus viviparus]|uniref:Choline transporter-like protein n=1 Tax=Dictyocaulus viviparus TaxID=29172 RepID=A0A0D8X9T0_DICVI|nr:hypothetical protein DICVIV_13515 [Dictyocaulus viviparus]
MGTTYNELSLVRNVAVEKILGIFVCTLACMEKCLQYINYNVFTAVNQTLCDLMLFLTECLIGGITAFCTYIWMAEVLPLLPHPWLPLLIMFVCAYQIANYFLSLYGMIIDTIMLCCTEELIRLTFSHLDDTSVVDQGMRFAYSCVVKYDEDDWRS